MSLASQIESNRLYSLAMKRLSFLLFIKAGVLALLILFYSIGLAPDEAQYWTWSQKLDWGYYSKPPLIAWQIWFTTTFLGNSALGVRFGALVIGFFIAIAVYAVARAAKLSQNTAFWAGVVTAFSPLGIYLSFAATTDGGAILFMTLAAAVVVKGIQEEEGPNYPLAGVCILIGGLYKWSAFVFWPFALLFFFFFKGMRKPSIFIGILISLVAFLPSIYWNMSHDWATFRHVSHALGETKSGNFWDFLGAQIGLLSPVFFVLLVMSYFYRLKSRELYFCAAFPAAVLIYLGMALFQKMQPNWAAYLYPPGLVLVAWMGCERLHKGRIWLHLGTWISIAMGVVLFSVPWIQQHTALPVPYKLNPFRQSMGWENLTKVLEEAGYNPEKDFLFGDKYQTASLLSFYSPSQKRAYYFNISQTRKNQFSYWPQMEMEQVGKTGYFVVLENTQQESLNWYEKHYVERLGPFFEHVEYRGAYPLYFAAGTPVKYALIFECKDYLGEAPVTEAKY